MALDEALLADDAPRPTLRFYTWCPSALSLGYFQRWAEFEPLAGKAQLVRRFSGGGAIHHADELTFSIAAPLAHPLYRGEVKSSYERVHVVLARAFEALGVRARLRGDERLASDRVSSGMCFHRSTPLDLAWDGAKGVGSAQRRTKQRVLHHGSIKLGRTALEEGVACLRTHAPDVSAEDLADSIATLCAAAWSIAWERSEPTPAEQRHAERRAPFYTSTEFVRRR